MGFLAKRFAIAIVVVILMYKVSSKHRVFKRDFQIVFANSTIGQCIYDCNVEWKQNFKAKFGVSAEDFYEFPIHPLLLDDGPLTAYCEIQHLRLRCYGGCEGRLSATDETADDGSWSPANYFCFYQHRELIANIPCLVRTEQRAFDKCDHSCHNEARMLSSYLATSKVGEVLRANETVRYSNELNYLCAYQLCFLNCHADVTQRHCSTIESAQAIRFYRYSPPYMCSYDPENAFRDYASAHIKAVRLYLDSTADNASGQTSFPRLCKILEV